MKWEKWTIPSSAPAILTLAVVACLGTFSLLGRVDRAKYKQSPPCASGCGDWQRQYAEMHRQIMAGRRPKRLCIATTRNEKGLYDRLTGSVPSPSTTVDMPPRTCACIHMLLQTVPLLSHPALFI